MRPPPLTPEMADAFGRTITASSAKAQRELRYRVIALNVMVKDCYEWMMAEGRI